MRILGAIGVFAISFPALFGQTCPAARILPADSKSAALDDSNCRLTDGSAYAPYRLDVPARGQLTVTLSASADVIVILRDSSGAQLLAGASFVAPVEAGSYQLLVNGRTPGQVGSYTITTSFTAEPGMLCSAFASLGLDQTANGFLGASGCATPGGAPYEAYWLDSFGPGSLTITVSSTDFGPLVTVRGEDGSAIASGQQRVVIPVEADSQYQVFVTTADTGGGYQISAAFQPDSDATCHPARTFTDSDSDTAAIAPDSCTTAIAGSGDLVYYNYYRLAVSAPGLVDLTSSSGDFAPILYLLDDGGNLLAVDSGSGPVSRNRAGAEIRMQLNPGNYVVQLFSSDASGGAYTLAYQFTPGAPKPCATTAASPGDALSGDLSAASCRSSLGLADIYSVNLPSAGTLEVTLDAPAFSSILAIRDAKDNLVVMDQDIQGLGVSHLAADLPPGSYTLVAAAASGAGHYEMRPVFTAHDLKPCSYVQPLDINGGYIQKLGQGSCPGSNGMPVDWYEFTLPSAGTVLAVMTSSEVDGFLTLVDSNGNVLRTDHNSYAVNDPMIVQYLPAGTYRIAARAFSNTVGGLYEIDLRSVLGPRPAFCLPKGGLTLGSSISATLTFTGCQYLDATFADFFQFNLTAPTTADVRLDSSDFDAYLVLLDAAGNVIDQDDDSGGGTNARITRSLPAGTYFVAAKAMGAYYNIGAYTLSLAKGQ